MRLRTGNNRRKSAERKAVEREKRFRKAARYGLLYGMGPRGLRSLAQQYQAMAMTMEGAAKAIRHMNKAFADPRWRAALGKVVKYAEERMSR